jgi:TolA-binding protein
MNGPPPRVGLGATPAPFPTSMPNAVARPAAAPDPRTSTAGPADEQALLTKAFRSLRSARDANAALAVLDEYVAHFPSGVLAPEAARLRTEALLLLGRKQAALAELERDGQNAIPAVDERRLLRGELRAAAGRWRAAAEDFDAVVRSSAAAGPAADAKSSERWERALWGRASAGSHLGDDAGARSDLQEYLRRFPGGRFAADASRLLGERR